MALTPPVPFFGSKRQAASAVWAALGDPSVYLEPFAGSLAVLLARPSVPRAEVAVDLDGLIVNFWRAIRSDPDAVLGHTGGPVSEVQVEAWHRHLVLVRPTLTAALTWNDAYYDAALAAMWWAGASSWLGSGWCRGDDQRTVSRQRPHIDRTLKGLYAVGCTDERVHALAARLANVVLLAGDWHDAWRRATSDAIINRFRGDRGGVGVFLDPPYAQASRQHGLYTMDADLPAEVEGWALTKASATVRIVVAGYADEYPGLSAAEWRVVHWSRPSGYVYTSGNASRHDDVLFLSPSCYRDEVLL